MRRSAWPLIIAALSGGACGNSGPGAGSGAPFTTTVTPDKPLVSLTGGESSTLCADVNRFASKETFKADSCRIDAVIASGLAAFFLSTATDAELRAECSQTYSQCLSSAVDAGTGSASSVSNMACGTVPANCTATVAELGTCLNDETAQLHGIASAFPDCSSLTRADFQSDGGSMAPAPGEPASCLNFQAKCSGLSDATKAFVSQYCALVDPCCGAEGLGSQCQAQLFGVAAGATFDDGEATACLDALRQRQGSNFCGGLRALNDSLTSWAVIPACAEVFRAQGTAPLGGACRSDADCAPGTNGSAVCQSKTFVDDSAPFSQEVCIGTSGVPGDGPCVGTIARINGGTGTSGLPNPAAQGVFCLQSKGVICDEPTRRCVRARGANEPCSSFDECDGATTYCNFNDGKCEARLPTGATCAGMLEAECEGNDFCDAVSKKCVPAKVGGATCTLDTADQCVSGSCFNDRCLSALRPVCQ